MASRLKCNWLFLAIALGTTEAHAEPVEQSNLAAWQEGYIEGLLAGHSLFARDTVEVNVTGGTAELTGHVGSRQARALAEQLALSAKGVDAVVNRLRVDAPKTLAPALSQEQVERHRLSNVTINNKVMSRILAHTQTRGLDINVQTSNRSVTVSGLVSTEVEKELVYWLVRNTEGVIEVVDNVQLAKELPQQAGL